MCLEGNIVEMVGRNVSFLLLFFINFCCVRAEYKEFVSKHDAVWSCSTTIAMSETVGLPLYIYIYIYIYIYDLFLIIMLVSVSLLLDNV